MLSPSARNRLIVVFAFIFCVVAAAAVRFGSVTGANTAASVLVPAITATNVDALLTDVDGDGRADPGDTIEYTVTINNTAPVGAGNDALGVQFNETLDANTTLVGGSVNSSPVANNDSFTVAGNVSISVPDGASDLLGNDIDPDTLNNTGLTASGGTTSAQGGNIVINANGSFTYNPPPGFEGTDTFNYTVTDPNGNTGTGTVTLNISGMVWFINNASPACTTLAAGCGRLSNPFSTLAAFVALNTGAGNNPGANDNIFIFESGTAYTGGVNLQNGQKLIGQDASATLASITGIALPSFSTAFPAMNQGAPATTIQGGAGSGVALNNVAGTNVVRGLSIGTSVPALSGTSFGTLTLSDVSINNNNAAVILNSGTANATFDNVTSTGGSINVSLTNIAGTVNLGTGALSGATSNNFLVNQGTAVISYAGTVTTNSGARPTEITNRTGGSVTFSGLVSTVAAGSSFGVLLTANTGSTVNFAGGLQLTTGVNAAFTATGGGTVNVTQNNTSIVNTLTTTSGTALNVANTTIGASGLTFRSISQSSGTSGIILNNTGASGGLTVTGNGGTCTSAATCTGGAINNTSGVGVTINNARNVSLTRMFIGNTGAQGISGSNMTDGSGGVNPTFELVNCRLTSPGDADNESAIFFGNITTPGNVTGRIRIADTVIEQFFENGIELYNNTGTLTVDVTGTLSGLTDSTMKFNDNDDTTGQQGILLTAAGTANITSNVSGAFFDNIESAALDIRSENAGAVIDVNWIGNVSINGGGPDNFPSGGGFQIIQNEGGSATFDIKSNTIRDLSGDGIVIINEGASQGRIGGPNVADGNLVSGSINGDGIRLDNDQIAPTGGNNFTGTILIQNNRLGNDATFPGLGDDGIQILSRDGNKTLNLTIISNTIANTGTLAGSGGEAIRYFTDADVSNGTNLPLNVVQIANNTMTNIDANDAIDAVVFQTQETARLCLNMTSNSLPASGNRNILLSQTGTGSFQISQASVAVLQSANTNSTTSPSGTITFNGSCNPPPPTNPLVGAENDLTRNLDKNVSFLSSAYQTPLEMLATLEPFGKHSATDWSATGSVAMSAEREKAFGLNSTLSEANAVTPRARRMQAGTLALQSVGAFFGEAFDRLGAAISPTVYSQGAKEEIPVSISGETITVGSPGGFTLPAGKNITIKFRATVNNTPVGLTQVSTQGTVSGSNFSNVLTDDPAVGGAANPTATLIDSTTIAVSSSQNPSITGQSVTFTATLTGAPVHATGDPAGTVEFFEDGNSLGTAAVVAGAANDNTGTATLAVTSLPAGSHVISATFSGGGGFNANNTSTNVTQVVSNSAVWDGSASSDWNTAANWTTNGVPSLATNDISIPAAGVTNNPTISAADVTVNSLTLSAGRTLTINTNRTLNVSGLLTMNGNNINASGGLVAFGTTGTVTRTSGSILGNVDKSFGATGAFTYHVGTATGYSPVSVNITALATNPSTLRVLANDGTAPAVPVLVDSVTLDRFWSLTETGDLTANVVFNYLQADVDGTETNYRTIRVTGTTAMGLSNGVPCPGGGSPCVDSGANTITVNGLQEFSNWTAGELAPTAANVSVSGRVFDATGRAVPNAQLSMIDENGNTRSARTNPFGYYRFVDVPAGSGYTVNVSHKLYNFSPRFILVTEDLTELNFTASP